MKKTILGLMLLLPVFAGASIDVNLKYGSTGPQVTELQEYLIEREFLTGSATGNFFSLTKKAVVAYQTSVGLPATGYVGPMTREVINNELSKNVSEEEVSAPVVTAPSNDTSTLKSQLDALMAQVALLIAEQKKTNEQAAQTTQAVQQVVTNTAPTPSYGSTQPVVTVPIVNKTVSIKGWSCNNHQTYGTSCEIEVRYFENDKPTVADITLSIDDPNGTVSICNCNSLGETLGASFTGNPVTGPTRKSGNDGSQSAYFQYVPSSYGAETIVVSYADREKTIPRETAQKITRNITVSVNGITKSQSFTTIYYSAK